MINICMYIYKLYMNTYIYIACRRWSIFIFHIWYAIVCENLRTHHFHQVRKTRPQPRLVTSLSRGLTLTLVGHPNGVHVMIYSPENYHIHWKLMVGRWSISFQNGLAFQGTCWFLGRMEGKSDVLRSCWGSWFWYLFDSAFGRKDIYLTQFWHIAILLRYFGINLSMFTSQIALQGQMPFLQDPPGICSTSAVFF